MSPLLPWSESLTLGIPEVDAHHRALVALLNELHSAVHLRRGATTCRETVEKLRRCALSHLDVEERLMHEAGHKFYREDLEEQRYLVHLLDDMLAGMTPESSNISFQRLHELKLWLLAHIRHTDPAAPDSNNNCRRVRALLLKRA